ASALAREGTRLFTFSTTTALLRPWLKLWRTTPCSTPRPFRDKVLVAATLSLFSLVFSVVSAIPLSIQFAQSHVLVRVPHRRRPSGGLCRCWLPMPVPCTEPCHAPAPQTIPPPR